MPRASVTDCRGRKGFPKELCRSPALGSWAPAHHSPANRLCLQQALDAGQVPTTGSAYLVGQQERLVGFVAKEGRVIQLQEHEAAERVLKPVSPKPLSEGCRRRGPMAELPALPEAGQESPCSRFWAGDRIPGCDKLWYLW